MTIKGLIFDLDGVITDTAEYHYLAWKKLAEDENLSFTREDNEPLRGVSREESFQRFLKGRRTLDAATAQEWMDRKNGYYKTLIAGITPADLLPGALDFLHAARQQGLRLGLGSASKNAQAVIQGLQVGDLFEVIGDGYAVVNTKPAVDLFVWVAGAMRLPVNTCIVFEDAEAGVDAALQAGMKCVGIGPQARVGHAHLVYDGLQSVRIEHILALG
jgi:beta-phosphoglucomutase